MRQTMRQLYNLAINYMQPPQTQVKDGAGYPFVNLYKLK